MQDFKAQLNKINVIYEGIMKHRLEINQLNEAFRQKNYV